MKSVMHQENNIDCYREGKEELFEKMPKACNTYIEK